jgi:multidrug transporter EmrE-like cation transporter
VEQKSNVQQNDRDHNARMALGMCIGLALGISIGVSLGSIPIGVAIGTGTGVALGMALSSRERQPSGPLTIAGVALLLVGIIVLALVMSLVLPHWWCHYPVLSLLPGC